MMSRITIGLRKEAEKDITANPGLIHNKTGNSNVSEVAFVHGYPQTRTGRLETMTIGSCISEGRSMKGPARALGRLQPKVWVARTTTNVVEDQERDSETCFPRLELKNGEEKWIEMV